MWSNKRDVIGTHAGWPSGRGLVGAQERGARPMIARFPEQGQIYGPSPLLTSRDQNKRTHTHTHVYARHVCACLWVGELASPLTSSVLLPAAALDWLRDGWGGGGGRSSSRDYISSAAEAAGAATGARSESWRRKQGCEGPGGRK